MARSNWFKSIKVVDRSRLMQTFAKRRDRDAPLPRQRGALIIDMGSWKYPRVGHRILYIDREETVYTTRDIQRIFDIDKTTVYQWIKIGLLPQPLFTRKNVYEKETRYWVRPQLAVAARVVNDLRRQGLIRFTKNRIKDHVAMIAAGNKIAIDEWHKRRDRETENRGRKKSGVTWDSHE